MTDEFDDLLDELDGPEHDGPDEDVTDEATFRSWYAQLPDFVRLDYPLDIPPYRLPAVRVLFDAIRTWRFCPDPSCGRGRACRGGDGPPCFRADRAVLSRVLFLTWLRMYWGLPEEEWMTSFARCAPRYAADEEPSPPREPGGGARRPARRVAADRPRKSDGVKAARGS